MRDLEQDVERAERLLQARRDLLVLDLEAERLQPEAAERQAQHREGSRCTMSDLPGVRRAPFSYYGGKQVLLSHILPLLPPHEVWCELFCGSAVVTLCKPPASIEILNDLWLYRTSTACSAIRCTVRICTGCWT